MPTFWIRIMDSKAIGGVRFLADMISAKKVLSAEIIMVTLRNNYLCWGFLASTLMDHSPT